MQKHDRGEWVCVVARRGAALRSNVRSACVRGRDIGWCDHTDVLHA